MTVLLTVEGGRTGARPWEISATPGGYSEPLRQTMRAIPGVRWNSDARCYMGDASALGAAVSLLELAGVVKTVNGSGGDPVMRPITEDVHAYVHRLEHGLRVYQQFGAVWCTQNLLNTGGALLADDMGIGKSPQAIVALDACSCGNVLVICPAVVRTAWRAKIARWARLPAAWTIMGYEQAVKAIKSGTVPQTTELVLDEIHYLANARSGRSKEIREWLAGLAAAGTRPRVLGLTGTPMPSGVKDLWHILDLLWPGRFGTFFQFSARYCDGKYEEIKAIERSVWRSEGRSHEGELAARLAPCMLRRTKAEVLTELPPLTREIITVELPPKAQKALRETALATMRSGSSHATGVGQILSNIEGYKIDAAEALAKELIAGGRRPLILTTRKATAHELGTRLGAPVVTGDTDSDARVGLIESASCACATLLSVTTGVDLVGFDVIIMVGLWWIPATMLQGEARAHRIGQLDPVTVYYLVGEHTLDEVVKSRVIERLDSWAAISGKADSMAGDLSGNLSEDDLIAALIAAAGKDDES